MRHLQALGEPPINDNQPYVFNEAELKKAVDEFVRVYNETSSGECEKVGIAFDTMMNKAGLDQIKDMSMMDYVASNDKEPIASIHQAFQYVSSEIKKALPDVTAKIKKDKEEEVSAKTQELLATNGTVGALYAINKQLFIDEKKSQGMSTAKKIMIFGGGALAIGGIIYHLSKRSSK